MDLDAARGVMLPFWGTSLGACCVFFMGRRLDRMLRRALTGFAAGVMTAAAVWSLLLPAIEQSAAWGRFAFLPAAGGFWLGVLFLLLLDRTPARADARRSPTAMLTLAVVLHNIPEGMAVGAAFAGWLGGSVPLAGALTLALGIAIQNFPEGAIISMPLRAGGMGKGRAFLYGVLSGAVEPAGAAATILAARLLVPALPWFLSFAAGAMVYVVVEELVPEMDGGAPSAVGPLLFSAGFTVMMAMDAALS